MYEVMTLKGALVAEVYVEDGKGCVEMVERPADVAWDFSPEELHSMLDGLKNLLLSWKNDDDAAKAIKQEKPISTRSSSRSSVSSSDGSDRE